MYSLKDAFRWGFLVKAKGCVLGKGESDPSSRVGWEGDGIFSLTRSCPWVVTLLDMERNCVLLSGDKVCLSSHCLWLCLWLICETSCYKVVQTPSVLQEKPDLFPWWKLSEWDKKKSPPNRQMPLSSKERGSAQADLDQELDLSLKWLCSDFLWGSHTQVCSIRSQAHLREDTTVWESGEGCWKEKILSHSHCREELITTA